MAMRYMQVPFEYLAEMQELTDEEFGRLIRAGLVYHTTKEVPVLSGNERFLWGRVKSVIDNACDRFAEVSEKRKAAGSMGGRAKAQRAVSAQQTAPPEDAKTAIAYYMENVSKAVPNMVIVRQINDFVAEMGNDLVIKALQITAEKGINDWTYAKRCLENWRDRGLMTLDAVEDAEMRFKGKKAKHVVGVQDENRDDTEALEQMARIRAKMGVG